jgi:hypothetical protein
MTIRYERIGTSALDSRQAKNQDMNRLGLYAGNVPVIAASSIARNRYKPHEGKKQLEKAAKRALEHNGS